MEKALGSALLGTVCSPYLPFKPPLYILGDAADQGADGFEIFVDLMRRLDATVLIGNHDRIMLDAINANLTAKLFG